MYFDYIEHPVHEPVLTDGRHKVVIAGAGPTGLALALGLARHGVPSVVLEAATTVCLGSRAACLSRRTLEIMQQLGVADRYLAKGLAWSDGTSYYKGAEVLNFAMPHDADQKFPPMINLQQCYAEQFLVDAVNERTDDLIDIRWGSRVEKVTPADDGVELSVRAGDLVYTMAADWLVGCDGARSVVREQLGLRLEGTAYEGRYVIVDVELKTDREARRYAWFNPPSNPGSTLLMHRQPDDIWRLDYQLGPDEDPEEAVKPENVMPRVRSHLRMIGEDENVEPVWISVYKANALTLREYRHGRVLFAGDAAHLVPIFGVRGMNSAVDDTHNLAWKLAYVASGRAPEALLDTYSAERVHAARENIRHASKSTEFMAPPSFAFSVMREAVLGLASEGHDWVASLINPRQTSAISYADCGTAGPDFEGPGPRPGSVLAELPVRDGHLTDLLGQDFTAFVFAPDGVVPAVLEAELATLVGGPAPVRTVVVDSAMDDSGKVSAVYGGPAVYLMRPDGHVSARWAAPAPGAVTRAVADLLEGGNL